MSQPSTIDFVTPFDPTAYTTITGGQLEQLVGGLGPNAGIGLIVSTTDSLGVPNVPNVGTTAKWANYFWNRITATATIPYVWNPNAASDPTYLQWQTIAAASIGVGTIVDSMIASNTITADKIASVNYSALINAPTGLPPTGAAGGVLSGTYPNPTIGNGLITSAMFAAGAVNTASLGAGSVVYTNLAANGTGLSMLRTNAGATAVEWFVPPTIFTSGVVVTTANALKIPQVATAGAGDSGTWQMINLPIQTRECVVINTTDNDGGLNHYSTASLPTTSNGKHIPGLDVTFTPKSNASTIEVEVILQLSNGSGTGGNIIVGSLFSSLNGTPTNAVAVGSSSSDVGNMGQVIFKYTMASTGAAVTFSVYYGGTASTTYLNELAAGAIFGSVLTSSITVTEYI